MKNKEGKTLTDENKKFLPFLPVFQLKSQSTNYRNLDLKLYCPEKLTLARFKFPPCLSANHDRVFAESTNHSIG